MYVCTTAERQYAIEAWRLLDPGHMVGPGWWGSCWAPSLLHRVPAMRRPAPHAPPTELAQPSLPRSSRPSFCPAAFCACRRRGAVRSSRCKTWCSTPKACPSCWSEVRAPTPLTAAGLCRVAPRWRVCMARARPTSSDALALCGVPPSDPQPPVPSPDQPRRPRRPAATPRSRDGPAAAAAGRAAGRGL